MSVNNVGWEPKKPVNGPPVILPPHWKCGLRLRGGAEGFISVEANADRKNRKYAHGPDGPFKNAGHMFEALERQIELPWGGATSLVTIYSNAHTGLRANNEDLSYVVKGRTHDGRWWVTGMFPIAHPKLPKGHDDPHAQSNDDQRDYEKDGARISRFSPDSFIPPMSVYDNIVGSLTFPK